MSEEEMKNILEKEMRRREYQRQYREKKGKEYYRMKVAESRLRKKERKNLD